MATLLAEVFANQTFSTTTYVYDSKGRVVERITRMGNLSEDRTTFRYNDRGDPIEEIDEHHSRGAGLDDHGMTQVTDERSHTSHTRFEYQYDDCANWIERMSGVEAICLRTSAGSNLIRRTITYY